MKPSKFSKKSTLSPVSKISVIALFFISNSVLAENYQSFSVLSYSQNNSSFKMPEFDVYSKNDSDSLTLFSKYYFEDQQTIGPLNEFDYINTSSNIYASVSNNSNDYSFENIGQSDSRDYDKNDFSIGGQWITNSFILGASYNYTNYEGKNVDYSYNESDSYYAAELGYLISDDFVINAYYNDGGNGDDFFSYSASYNLQLADSDYIGFSYNVNEDFDLHTLSTRYFFSFSEQSYFVVGGDYTVDNRYKYLSDDTWSVNASYYYDAKTSLSVSYAEDDLYSIGARYYINQNYSVQAGYNSVTDSEDGFEYDGYYFSFGAQF